jgi:hypothetical protein
MGEIELEQVIPFKTARERDDLLELRPSSLANASDDY